MGLLDNLRAALGERAPARPQAPAPAPAPAQMLGRFEPRGLRFEDFQPRATLTGAANVPVIIAEYEVPAGEVLQLDGVRPFRALFKAKHEAAIAPDANGTVVVDLGAAGFDVVRSSRTAPAFPTKRHPDVRAYISSDAGATWTEADVTAADFGANTVTVAKVAGTNRVKLFFTFGGGEFRVRVIRPTGSDVVAPLVYNQPFKALHETDQSNGESAPRLGLMRGRMPFLPPRWRVALEVYGSPAIPWEAAAGHELYIPANRAPVLIANWKAIEAIAEQEWRGGL